MLNVIIYVKQEGTVPVIFSLVVVYVQLLIRFVYVLFCIVFRMLKGNKYFAS